MYGHATLWVSGYNEPLTHASVLYSSNVYDVRNMHNATQSAPAAAPCGTSCHAATMDTHEHQVVPRKRRHRFLALPAEHA